MTLYDFSGSNGAVTAIGGDEDTHRRLVDMGLLGAEFTLKARRRGGAMFDFGDFSAVVGSDTAKEITVREKVFDENSALRKPECRKDHSF